MSKARSGKVARNLTPVPDDFTVTAEMLAWAAERGVQPPAIKSQTERFLDHHRAKGTLFKDWTAAWRTWMRNFIEWNPKTAAAEDDDIPEFVRNAK